MTDNRRPTLRRRLASHALFRNVLILTGGTSLAQLIALASTPVITRLYDPDVYGLYGTFTGIVTVVAPFAGLALPLAIVYAESRADRIALAKLCLITSLSAASIALVVLLVFGESIASVLGTGHFAPILYCVPPAIFLAGIVALLRHWNIRARRFGVKARGNVVHSTFQHLGQIALGLTVPTALSLTGTYTAALAVEARALRPTKFRASLALLGEPTSPLTQTLAKYREYPLFRAPQSLLNALNQYVPLFALSVLAGPVAAGLYALARLVVMAPAQLVGRSVLEAFAPDISTTVRRGAHAFRSVRRLTLILALVAILPFGIIIGAGPWLFEVAFGADWRNAGDYARWISVWMYFVFANRACVAAIPALGIQGLFLAYEGLDVVLKIALSCIAILVGFADISLVLLLGVTGAVVNAALILHVLAHARGRSQAN